VSLKSSPVVVLEAVSFASILLLYAHGNYAGDGSVGLFPHNFSLTLRLGIKDFRFSSVRASIVDF
jgi:hypothetical protein